MRLDIYPMTDSPWLDDDLIMWETLDDGTKRSFMVTRDQFARCISAPQYRALFEDIVYHTLPL